MGLIYRLEKGSRLTHEQLDENFRYLNSKVAEVSAKTEIASSQVSVIPKGGLSYAVRADSYPIGEIDYSATPMTITLAAASTTPNFDRLDLIYADVNGNIGKITGVAGTDTAPPDFDPTTQYVIRFILVKANALVGTDPITDIDIVDFYLYKNGGENGFVPTANNASITINNTVAPISETQDVKGYLTSISHKFTLTSPVELNFADFDNLIFDCKVTPEHQYWFIYFFTANRSSVIGTNLFTSGTYGLDKTIATAQTCIIPIKDVFPKTSTFNRIVIFATQPNGIWQVDNVRLGKGSGLVPLNHTHTNLSVLEQITQAFVNAWNSASSWVTTNGANVLNHLANIANPHGVTKSQVGLGNADNTSDVNKPISTATQTALNLKLDASAYNQHFKGVYLTFAALTAAHPTAEAGDYAQVNETGATDVLNYNWDAEENIWIPNAVAGSGANNTDQLPEGTANLYFTTARVLNTLLTGISFLTGTAVVATDSILVGFGKLQKQISDLISSTTINASGFIKNLSPTDDTVQKVFNKVDALVLGGEATAPAVSATYTSIANMIAAQGTQILNALYKVDDGTTKEVYQYLGTTLGTIADYDLIWRLVSGQVSGSNLPTTGLDTGLFFRVDKVNRHVLMQYNSATGWDAVRSFGTMTIWVNSLGTDNDNYGDGTGVNAFKTIAFAIKQIPPQYYGDVNVIIQAGTYTEQVYVNGKEPVGDFKIKITGEYTSITGSITSIARNTSTGRFSPSDSTKAWTVNEHKYKFLHITSGVNIGCILPIISNTATELTCSYEAYGYHKDSYIFDDNAIFGVSSNGNTYEIITPTTLINGHIFSKGSLVNCQLLKFTSSSIAYNYGKLFLGAVQLYVNGNSTSRFILVPPSRIFLNSCSLWTTSTTTSNTCLQLNTGSADIYCCFIDASQNTTAGGLLYWSGSTGLIVATTMLGVMRIYANSTVGFGWDTATTCNFTNIYVQSSSVGQRLGLSIVVATKTIDAATYGVSTTT